MIRNIYEILIFDDIEFVSLAYQCILGRNPDEQGLRYYRGRLASGYSKESVISQLARSPERSEDINIDGLDALLRRERTLRIWFLKWFCRSKINYSNVARRDIQSSRSDSLQLVKSSEYQVVPAPSRLSQEEFYRRLSAEIFHEEESGNLERCWLADFLSLDEESFLNSCFFLILGRKPDQIGKMQYYQALLNGRDRLNILCDIYFSEEAERVRAFSDFESLPENELVDALYLRMLSRPADSLGKQSYVQMLREFDLGTVVRGIKMSEEYREKNPERVQLERLILQTLKDNQGHLQGNRENSTVAERDYQDWIRRYEKLSFIERKLLTYRAHRLARRPIFNVVMIGMDSGTVSLEKAVQSLINQIYPGWRLYIAGDLTVQLGDPASFWANLSADDRIIFRNSGDGEDMESLFLESEDNPDEDTFVLFMEAQDMLSETALFWMAETLNRYPKTLLLYSDEDRLGEDKLRSQPWFKPDFNYELLLTQDLMGKSTVYEKGLLRELGGLNPSLADGCYWDLSVRATEHLSPGEIRHIPRILFHQALPVVEAGSNALNALPSDLRRRIIMDHLQRKGVRGAQVVDAPEIAGCNRVIYALPEALPKVAIIIPTRDHANLLRRCVTSIQEKTNYAAYEIIIVDNGSQDNQTLALFHELSQKIEVRIERLDIPFNYSTLNNLASQKTDADMLCFLNDDTEVLTTGWLCEMVSQAIQEGVGVVGARLWYPDGTVQHAGVITGVRGVADHIYRGSRRGDCGDHGRAVLTQSLSAVTGACMVMKRRLFEQLDGFDENYAVELNDIDLCLRAQDMGFRNIWTPYAELIHHEKSSRGRNFDLTQERALEQMTYLMRWGEKCYADPAYNSNLSLEQSDAALSYPPRQTRFGEPAIEMLALIGRELFPELKDIIISSGILLFHKNKIVGDKYDAAKKLAEYRLKELWRLRRASGVLQAENVELLEQLFFMQESLRPASPQGFFEAI
ncbi:DUF4214 domain-containing protein [Acidithiobacillus ferriphilus]|uniref:DUF4214 domain-containing protein n=1 Tax=Acidithiobacillus ferriphilus TaxID=1689834 RepID=UPI00390CCA5A